MRRHSVFILRSKIRKQGTFSSFLTASQFSVCLLLSSWSGCEEFLTVAALIRPVLSCRTVLQLWFNSSGLNVPSSHCSRTECIRHVGLFKSWRLFDFLCLKLKGDVQVCVCVCVFQQHQSDCLICRFCFSLTGFWSGFMGFLLSVAVWVKHIDDVTTLNYLSWDKTHLCFLIFMGFLVKIFKYLHCFLWFWVKLVN